MENENELLFYTDLDPLSKKGLKSLYPEDKEPEHIKASDYAAFIWLSLLTLPGIWATYHFMFNVFEKNFVDCDKLYPVILDYKFPIEEVSSIYA